MKALTLRAEEALLGAMITDPEIARGVSYLDSSDFYAEGHRKLFSAIMSALTRESLPGQSWCERIEMDAQVRPRYLVRMAAACPEPDHGLSYGALVLQGSARRNLSRAGYSINSDVSDLQRDVRRLRKADGIGSRRVSELADHADHVAQQLRALSRVFNPDETWSIAVPSRPARGRARQEQRILAALLQGHPQSDRVLQLPADGFGDPEHRDIFRAIRRLHVNARDIDALTVDWEVSRSDENEGTTGLRDAVTATAREPSYVTTLAAADIGTIQVARTASSLLGAPRADRPRIERPRPARTGEYQAVNGGRFPSLPEPYDPGPGFPVHRM